MTPVDAIKTGLRKSFTFKGRASRSEYWWFLPVGIAVPAILLFGLRFIAPESAPWIYFICLFIGLIPLVSVTARRAHDSGQNIDSVWIPTKELIGFLLTASAAYSFHNWATQVFDTMDGPAGFGMTILYWPTIVFLLSLTLRFLIVGFLTGTALFSQMAYSSQPHTNTYGPNPNEVPND